MMANSRPNSSLSKREEDSLVEAGRRVLVNGGYPNPDRVGCPRSQVLKAIAERKMDLRLAEEWVLHLGSCSPCFIEYSAFRKQAERHKNLELLLATAAVLLVIVVGGWLWKVNRSHGTGGDLAPYQAVNLDLRNWMVFRGEETSSANTGPVQLPRGRLALTIYLPMGSKPGNYEVQVSTELGQAIASAAGTATVQDGVTVLKAKLDVSKVNPGNYLLGIGQTGVEGRSYPLVMK
jgi:hypothetical protein